MNTPAYAANAASFEARHGFPAPPADLMATVPGWPLPFCDECCDWHLAGDECSMGTAAPDVSVALAEHTAAALDKLAPR